MKSTKEYKELEKKYYMQVVNRMPPVLVEGDGTVVKDNDGKESVSYTHLTLPTKLEV